MNTVPGTIDRQAPRDGGGVAIYRTCTAPPSTARVKVDLFTGDQISAGGGAHHYAPPGAREG